VAIAQPELFATVGTVLRKQGPAALNQQKQHQENYAKHLH
jgi:hypothetical protein